jgi:4-oxalocrotonate tautomerase
MPYVNIKITNEGASSTQKAALISGVTEVLVGVLGKDPATTFVVIDEVETEHWGIGGLPVEEYRRHRQRTRPGMTEPTRGNPLGRSASNGGAWRGRA